MKFSIQILQVVVSDASSLAVPLRRAAGRRVRQQIYRRIRRDKKFLNGQGPVAD